MADVFQTALSFLLSFVAVVLVAAPFFAGREAEERGYKEERRNDA